MLVGTLMNSLQARPTGAGLVRIVAGTYFAGGVDTPVEEVTVDQDFYTPPGEVTNAEADAVIRKFSDRPNGLFLRDQHTGYRYLYAMGQGDDVQTFETIDPRLVPPQLGIGDSFEAFAKDAQVLAHMNFDTKNVRRVLPREDRYQGLENEDKFADGHVAITRISGWQAQAVAQLLGDEEIADRLFGVGGMGGAFYADLLTSQQWGLMAMEGVLEFMTSTGQLTGLDGEKLRAFDLPHIVRATDYPALPNGILPNTVWNWVKDFIEQGKWQVLRGGSWIRNDRALLRLAYRDYEWPDGEEFNYIGLRVGYFPRG